MTVSPEETERRRIMASRNKMLALVLVGFVVLFFAITIVKRGQNSAASTKAALVGNGTH
jgi:hypothetical protein